MKKLITLLSWLSFIIALTSCEGKTGPMGPPGPPGSGEESYWYIDYIEVRAEDWQKYDGPEVAEPNFYAIIQAKGIDKKAYDEGIVNVFIEIDETVKIAMPHTVYHVESDGYKWSANYTYEYEIGKLIVSVRYSDLDMSRKPGTEFFYLVVTSPL